MSDEREVLASRLADFIFGYIIDADYLNRLDEVCETIATNLTDDGVNHLNEMINVIEKELTESLGWRSRKEVYE